MISLTIALGILQLLDWFTTRTILKAGGYEQNVIMKDFFDHFGVDPVLGVKVVIVTGMGYLVGRSNIYVLAGLVVLYIGIIIHNWRSMPK